jgi:peptide/nickel transport system ATP-binding protein
MEPLVKIHNLVLKFDTFEGAVHVLDGVDLVINKGEVFGLVGETGCGKTQLSRCIGKLLAANARIEGGEIIFNGKNVLKMSDEELETIRGKAISYVFQEPLRSLNPLMKVWEQVTDHVRDESAKKDVNKRRDIAIKLLEIVGIPTPERIIDSYPHELSGGMRQRVAVAIAILNKPELIIADEPTTALDALTQLKLLRLFLDLKQSARATLLLITHNLGIVAELCDRVAILYAGQIAEVAPTVEVFKKPLHPYTQGLLKAVPRIGTDEELYAIPGMLPNLTNPPSGCRFHPRCKFAMPICPTKKPALSEIEKDHFVACYLYHSEFP